MNVELPGGVVTFVFTDIQGSTALFRSLGDAYPPLLEAHNEILRSVWKRHNGAEVKTEGDAFFVAFADPTQAIRASVDAIEALAAHPWPDHADIKVRIGMHTGVGYPRDGDYIAYPVHQAARIGGVGHGGQVVVSPETAELAGDLGDIRMHDLGSFRVRDFDHPIHLLQAERSDTPTQFDDLRTKADVQHNLPADLPDAHGRADDLAGIAEQLEQSRAVSIVGPGGVGKTLVARTLARDRAASYEDGAWFVDLASHTDGSTLSGAIADVLAITPEELEEHLASRHLLMVLDNAEQATNEVARLATRLLDQAPRLSVLVTSREPLAIAAERVWRLSLMTEVAATALFVERATAVAPGFDAPANAADIAELCRRLDGLPLAIELAAARVTALSVPEIVESLSDRLRILRSRRRDLDERQRTALGLVDWSYRLLEDDEQLVFRRLAVFAGSFDLDAATAACEDSGLDRIDVGDIVWSLVEKSLVMPVIGDGTSRYRLLETLRAFGRQSMVDAEELEPTQRQIGHWYRSRFDPTLAFTRLTALSMSEEVETIRTLARDLAPIDPSLGQWLAWSIGLYFKNSDPARGLAEMAPLLEALTCEGEAVVGMLAIAGHLAASTNQLDRATELTEQAAAFAAAMPEPVLASGWERNTALLILIRQGDLQGAGVIANEAMANAQGLERVSLVNSLGIVQAELGDLPASAASFEQVLALALEFEALDAQVVATMAIAEIAHRLGNLGQAIESTASGLRMSEEAGMRAQTALGLVGAARLLADSGDHAEAVIVHTAADRLMTETGQTLFEGDRVISENMYADANAALGEAEFARCTAVGAGLVELDAFARATAALDAQAGEIAATL